MFVQYPDNKLIMERLDHPPLNCATMLSVLYPKEKNNIIELVQTFKKVLALTHSILLRICLTLFAALSTAILRRIGSFTD